MRKIKKPKSMMKQEEKKPMDMKSKAILFSVIGVAVLIMIVLIMIESLNGKIVISNNTNLKLEYVKAYFVDVEGPVNDGFSTENLEAGKEFENALNKIDLLGTNSNLEVRFKFENQEEMLVDAGFFNDAFDGKITIDFSQKEEDYAKLRVKASNGLLPSQLIQCDEEYIINLKEGYLED